MCDSENKLRFSTRFLTGACNIEHEVAWLTGAPLCGLNFKKTDAGWLLVVKAVSAQRGGVVAFFGGADPEDCLDNFARTAASRYGINWKQDLY